MSLQSRISAAPGRPILTSLNGDSSWLLSFPKPFAARQTIPGGKLYYHIVLDPWLAGPSSYGSWLIHIELVKEAKIKDGKGVDVLVKEIELAAGGSGNAESAKVDAIFVSARLTDHMHEATLCTFDPAIPVFAAPEATSTIEGWKHFDTVMSMKDFTPNDDDKLNWRNFHPSTPLPSWLSVFRLAGHTELNFATAIVWTPSPDNDSADSEAIIYSPHGIHVSRPTIQSFLKTPNISILAMLHGLKLNRAFGVLAALGVPAGLALERVAKPRYWVNTHDSELRYSGIVMWIGWVKDYWKTIEEGMQMIGDKGPKPNFVDVPMEDSLLLV
ncbi:hypothetical protein MIND_00596500 [Mycena indigotica]|uniref:Uncharacterized protein n=1 Tax=Mycena indigotica TaxID=2126181 RepID=A0A8H6SS25_9AGAR|nr:uncharacterized protein MIND_00596500 [Mycena indigotica]KAF7303671.1 hypothetical protein MIND_00596500 [Mycena indigotica]